VSTEICRYVHHHTLCLAWYAKQKQFRKL